MRGSVTASSVGGSTKNGHADWFRVLAVKTAFYSGRPVTFCIAVAIVAVWGITGPIFHYSDTWQLIINTGTTIVTFLMVFLIQATQNRDTAAIQLKLDELIRAGKGRNRLIAVEELSDEELEELKAQIGARSTGGAQRHPAKTSAT
jgi:low affinity Fe/Cu permease